MTKNDETIKVGKTPVILHILVVYGKKNYEYFEKIYRITNDDED